MENKLENLMRFFLLLKKWGKFYEEFWGGFKMAFIEGAGRGVKGKNLEKFRKMKKIFKK